MWNYFNAKLTPPEKHVWPEHEIVWEDEKNRLLGFRKTKGTPLVIVAPEAGHNSLIVHYAKGNSLLDCALENYSGPVYVLEKLPATQKTKSYSIQDCFSSLYNAIVYLGESVNLVGLCQGGWQSAIVTARHPESVCSLTLAAAPIDFHAGHSQITSCVKAFGYEPFRNLVAWHGGILPGEYMLAGFLAANPFLFLKNELDLWNDPGTVEKYNNFNRWYIPTQDLAGAFYLDAVRMFHDNTLGEYGPIGEIKCRGNLITGTKDKLTPPEQTLALKGIATGADFKEYEIEAGHIGVFMSAKGLKKVWSGVFREM